MSSEPVDRLVSVLQRTQPLRQHTPKKPAGQGRPRASQSHTLGDKVRLRNTLVEARKLIETGWVRAEIAVDDEGEPVAADSPHAAAWCLDGALQAGSYKVGYPGTASSTSRIEKAARLILTANDLMPEGNEHVLTAVARINDFDLNSQAEVLQAIDKALATFEE